MAGIVFYFEENDIDVWSGRKIDLDAWNYNCKIGLIDKAIIINKTNIKINSFDLSMNINIVSEIPELLGHKTQLITPNESIKYNLKTESIWDFNHETDWYLFGPANGWGGNHFADCFINIPQNNLCYHHSVFVASTIMYDRYNKINKK